MKNEDYDNNIFDEEFQKVAGDRTHIVLNDVMKISLLDDAGEYKINLSHIHDDKDGKFSLNDFAKLTKITEQKDKIYKRYEFASQLQAHFTLLMWKKVCSNEGEKQFTSWIKTLLLETQSQNINESEEDINPDPSKYIDRATLRILYDVLNVKTTHGIDFQSFFELMKLTSDELEEESIEDYVHVGVLDLFCKNFIRGFSKLILDLGFDSFMSSEFEIN